MSGILLVEMRGENHDLSSKLSVTRQVLEQIAADGLEALPVLIRVLINEAMWLEREQYPGAKHAERSQNFSRIDATANLCFPYFADGLHR